MIRLDLERAVADIMRSDDIWSKMRRFAELLEHTGSDEDRSFIIEKIAEDERASGERPTWGCGGGEA